MHCLLIDQNPKMIEAWGNFFGEQENVKILQGDLTNVSVDAIVSPANSFGFMDGGVDYAISERLGWDLQIKLQQIIKDLPEMELLVGKALVLETGDSIIPYLISAPTMRVPMDYNIATSINAYLAMKATLIIAKNHPNISYIAIPGFCTGVGKMPFEVSARQMFVAYQEIVLGKKLDFASFGDSQLYHWKINPIGMIYNS